MRQLRANCKVYILLDDIRLPTKDTAKVAAFLVSDAGAALNSLIVDVDFGQTNVI